MTTRYSLDTSSLIRAWHEAYPIDVAPTFWDHLQKTFAAQRAMISEEVLRETSKRSSDLHAWLKQHGNVIDLDDEQQQCCLTLLAKHPLMAKNRKGADAADPWVIALAQSTGATVVSEESLVDSEKRPKIPGICAQELLPCINLLAFMRANQWRL